MIIIIEDKYHSMIQGILFIYLFFFEPIYVLFKIKMAFYHSYKMPWTRPKYLQIKKKIINYKNKEIKYNKPFRIDKLHKYNGMISTLIICELYYIILRCK